MSFSGEFPVLIEQADLAACDDDIKKRNNFWVGGIEPVLEQKAAEGRDAISDAVGLLLTTSAVALVHIDLTKKRKSYYPDDDRIFYERPEAAVGFNDHFGGSESRFKILLNGSPDGDKASYVLFSPPKADGSPTNTTFRRSHFVILTRESDGIYGGPGYVPNPLKTADTAGYKGLTNYQYFIFGDSNVPQEVYHRFAESGFEFISQPYDTSEYREMRVAEQAARASLDYRGGHYWPGDQFADNLKRIGIEPPKLSPEDYPLVRAENMLLS